MKKMKYASLVGLAFGNKRLDICVLRRSAKGIVLEKSLKVSLALDPLSAEPELAGQELRNHLSSAGIRERNCVICVPLKWALTLHLDLPDLPEADLDDYIAMQAERDLPFGPEDLAVTVSRTSGTGGSRHATVAALPQHHLESVRRICKAAGLKPLLITPSVAALPASENEGTVNMLRTDEGDLDLAIAANEGVVLLRSLNQSDEQKELELAEGHGQIAQQLRITLGRLPDSIRDSIESMRLYGTPEHTARMMTALKNLSGSLGLRMDPAVLQIDGQPVDPSRWSPALNATADCLLGNPPLLDFLPPTVSRFRQFAGVVSARRTLYLGGSGIAVVLILALTFGIQTMNLKRLERKWSAMRPRVERVESLQQKVRTFRPWFDASAPSLGILARVTAAFPVTGSVWVKSVEVKDIEENVGAQQVTCSGSARSSRDWLAVLDALRKTPGIGDLEVTQVKGDSPLQFTMSFRWEEGATHVQ